MFIKERVHKSNFPWTQHVYLLYKEDKLKAPNNFPFCRNYVPYNITIANAKRDKKNFKH